MKFLLLLPLFFIALIPAYADDDSGFKSVYMNGNYFELGDTLHIQGVMENIDRTPPRLPAVKPVGQVVPSVRPDRQMRFAGQ